MGIIGLELVPLLRVHHGDGRHIHDVIDFRAALQDVHRMAHAHEDRADSFRPANARQQLVGHVAASDWRRA